MCYVLLSIVKIEYHGSICLDNLLFVDIEVSYFVLVKDRQIGRIFHLFIINYSEDLNLFVPFVENMGAFDEDEELVMQTL